jgi:hypothetical protein
VGYLDGNSPGPRAKRAADRIRRVMLEEWGSGLIRSWNLQGWIDLPIVDRARQIGSLSERFVVVTLTHVDLRADGLHDMASVTAATRCADALTLLDLSHSCRRVSESGVAKGDAVRESEIDPDITIEDLLTRVPEASVILRRFGIVCVQCGEPVWGTLRQLAAEKGMHDLGEVLAALRSGR